MSQIKEQSSTPTSVRSASLDPDDIGVHPAGTTPEDSAYEALTVAYERLRHSEDSNELSNFARRPLPDRANQSDYSRATALLEAVAGNPHTPVEDRVFLAKTMPFPNVLVTLASDVDDQVRQAVASNTSDKNWLVGTLTKDSSEQVRDAALRNPQTSWKMRLEGAQNTATSAETLDYLGSLGTKIEPDAPKVLAAMVRRAVALNPSTDARTLQRLCVDPNEDVVNAVKRRTSAPAEPGK